MCWSATADLVGGGVVIGVGLAGIAMVRDRRDAPLAAVPLILGAHQLVESRIWSESAGSGSVLRGPAVLVWTAIAFVVLPMFVPVAVLLAERRRRSVHLAAVVVGIPVAVVMALSIRSGTYATDHGHVMEYSAGIPLLPLVIGGYLFATCVPFLSSREPTMRELGWVLIIAAAVATITDVLAFASIWCAFAAVVSVLIVRRTIHASRWSGAVGAERQGLLGAGSD